jgi:hypothetical protein
VHGVNTPVILLSTGEKFKTETSLSQTLRLNVFQNLCANKQSASEFVLLKIYKTFCFVCGGEGLFCSLQPHTLQHYLSVGLVTLHHTDLRIRIVLISSTLSRVVRIPKKYSISYGDGRKPVKFLRSGNFFDFFDDSLLVFHRTFYSCSYFCINFFEFISAQKIMIKKILNSFFLKFLSFLVVLIWSVDS